MLGSRTQWAETTGPGICPCRPGRPTRPGLFFLLGTEAPGEVGVMATLHLQGGTGLGERAPRRDGPRLGSSQPLGSRRLWLVLTALAHADVGVRVEEGVSVRAEAAFCQPSACSALAPAR